jgi:hypothetical protein
MSYGITFKAVRNKLAIAAAAAGLLVSFTGSAHADGGYYDASTSDGCGYASGTYHWYATGTAGGHTKYRTDWNFDVTGYCSQYTEGLYTTYDKWDGSKWVWHGFTRIPLAKTGTDVRDVNIYVCHVGHSICGSIFTP